MHCAIQDENITARAAQFQQQQMAPAAAAAAGEF